MEPGDFSNDGPVAITHTRGPLNPRTWSGAPLALSKALETLGFTVHGIDSGIRPLGRKVAFAAQSVLRGYGPLYFRARPARAFSAALVQRQATALGCHTILHCGTLDLPAAVPDRGLTHVMYTDTTWDMWHEDSRYRLLTGRLLRHAEQLDREAYEQLSHIFLISNYVRQRMIDGYGVAAEKITVVGTGRG